MILTGGYNSTMHIWYTLCPGVTFFSSVSTAAAALQTLSHLYKPSLTPLQLPIKAHLLPQSKREI